MKRTVASFLAITLGFGVSACDEGGKKPELSTATPPAEVIDNKEDADLCTKLRSNSFLVSSFKAFLDDLCTASRLASLRAEANVYVGKGSPNVGIESSEAADDKSDMKVYSSMMTPAKPRDYFNMQRLKISRPDDFRATFPELNNQVTYTVGPTTDANKVNYRYRNTSNAPEFVVEYESTASFVAIDEGSTYVVTTQFVKSHETVIGIKGMIVINKKMLDGLEVSEVFSISDQRFDNNGDHESSVGKARSQFAEEVRRDFVNSNTAASANSFFPGN